MADLRELYQQVILDHYKRPRHFGKLEGSTHAARGYNPLCGDKINLAAKIADGRIEEIAFEGSGCAISTASSSVMCETVKGRTESEIKNLFDGFHKLVTGDPGDKPAATGEAKLDVFAGVREFPARVKCATLSWHTLRAALENKNQPISTE